MKKITVSGILFLLGVIAFLPISASGEPAPSFDGLSRSFVHMEPSQKAPLTPLINGQGTPVDLSAFRGKVVLLNFWASWCTPCRKEMPALDKLQAALGEKRFQVVAVSEDDTWKTARNFLKKYHLKNLVPYLDHDGAAARAFKGFTGDDLSLPTSFLINQKGNVVGYLQGMAQWDDKDARRFITHYTAR